MLERASSASRGNLSRDGGGERLAERRRLRRRRGLIAFCILFFFVVGGLVWGLWQPPVRIAHIEVYGDDASLADYAENEMHGSYFGIIPRDSIIFFPASRIRADILAAHSDIAAVSLFREGFTGLSIKTHARAPIARWCGSILSTSSPQATALPDNCYIFDASGYIYAIAATSTQTINTFIVYAPLANAMEEPLHANIAHAEKLPTIFDFARRLDTLGSPVAQVVIRNDEVDDYLSSGTRITYVLGRENTAFTAIVSARGNINLADGSLEYVDLRFDGKVYLKKK